MAVAFSKDTCKAKWNSLFLGPKSSVYSIPLPMCHPLYVKVHNHLPSLLFYQSALFCGSHPWESVYFWSIPLWLWRVPLGCGCFGKGSVLILKCRHAVFQQIFTLTELTSCPNGRQPCAFPTSVNRVNAFTSGLQTFAAWSPTRALVCYSAH